MLTSRQIHDVGRPEGGRVEELMLDPIGEIRQERERARETGDPLTEVCYLVTVASTDRAEGRALTLRHIADQGFGVLINLTSPKWQQLSRTGTATLLIHWPSVRRQYRIWGSLAPMEPQPIDAYWRRKSYGSKLLEHYYTAVLPQSHRVASRQEFLAGIETVRQRYPEQDAVPLPQSLAGIYVVPREIEAWHGSEERLHDRRLFQKSDMGWASSTLVP